MPFTLIKYWFIKLELFVTMLIDIMMIEMNKFRQVIHFIIPLNCAAFGCHELVLDPVDLILTAPPLLGPAVPPLAAYGITA